MKEILLHICCAPCSIYPVESLKKKGLLIKGYFYNPNIHPPDEYVRRKETLKKYGSSEKLDLIVDDYDMETFFDKYKSNEDRCVMCYYLRLEKSAKKAKELGIGLFSSTLLYSKRQKHFLIKEIACKISNIYDIEFYYEDFREGWNRGIAESKRLGLYRQNYCGCIFSYKERFGEALENKEI
ncbi:MAG: epoxyqueuosine reductase QueH [Proteobacteria bacterium]|nr:epoxyqueuosine reductase QueH [Pseudomonadota bacterium]